MRKYIIMGVTEKMEKLYISGNDITDFKWVKDHKQANHYCDYELALIDWDSVIKFMSDGMKRIFIPIYDINDTPWKE